jgi:hypothetical protein
MTIRLRVIAFVISASSKLAKVRGRQFSIPTCLISAGVMPLSLAPKSTDW